MYHRPKGRCFMAMQKMENMKKEYHRILTKFSLTGLMIFLSIFGMCGIFSLLAWLRKASDSIFWLEIGVIFGLGLFLCAIIAGIFTIIEIRQNERIKKSAPFTLRPK